MSVSSVIKQFQCNVTAAFHCLFDQPSFPGHLAYALQLQPGAEEYKQTDNSESF